MWLGCVWLVRIIKCGWIPGGTAEDFVCKVCHHLREGAPCGGVWGTTKGQTEGHKGKVTENGDGLGRGRCGVGNTPVRVAVVVFGNEDWYLGVGCPERDHIVDDAVKAPAVDHFRVFLHVDAVVDGDVGGAGRCKCEGEILGKAVFGNFPASIIYGSLGGKPQRLNHGIGDGWDGRGGENKGEAVGDIFR